ncbi:DinB family protein [Neobacillus bataviensis]|uniref:DinB family protein n=1 Tax=Neobacillus bataviensis TaxID=220685 RepID=UPI001CBC0606|nr:DinB family protein [Neobacillus bataviensis]
MNRKDVILEQFLLSHNKNGWFVSFQSAAAGLTDEQAVWKGEKSENSILEIVSHLVFWNERYLNRFKEIPIPEKQGDNDSTFTAVLEWAEAVERFNSVMTDWYRAVSECEDAKLDQPVNPDSNHPWIETLTSITLHNAYHIGQIVTIRKMQGSWDKEQGVS